MLWHVFTIRTQNEYIYVCYTMPTHIIHKVDSSSLVRGEFVLWHVFTIRTQNEYIYVCYSMSAHIIHKVDSSSLVRGEVMLWHAFTRDTLDISMLSHSLPRNLHCTSV